MLQLLELLRRLTVNTSASDQQQIRRAADAQAELQALSDRELADLGISRGLIAHAVRHGREGVAADAIDR
jgi:uncharacterized protein YjiS (DUF1127 family)